MSNTPLFSLKDVTCGYSTGFETAGVSLSLEEGAFAGIVGANGSGKTTLFKGISGTLPLKRGTVEINGRDLSSFSLKEKAREMAIVTQFRDPVDLTAQEYVLMGRLPYRDRYQFFDKKEDIALAEHYMELTQTTHLRHKNMKELSGGEQQMLSIASALAQQPTVLLLDEPTAHLDIRHQMAFMNLLQELNEREKLTVLMILHDLSMAAEYCDYILMMKRGRPYAQGRPHDVLTYENIEAVFDTVVVVSSNPVSGKPIILPISARYLKSAERP